MAKRKPLSERREDSTGPVNTTGMEFFDVTRWNIATWGPNPDGRPPQSQVHMSLFIDSPLAAKPLPPLVMRFHGRNTISDMIELLTEYRDTVWNADGSLTTWAETGER